MSAELEFAIIPIFPQRYAGGWRRTPDATGTALRQENWKLIGRTALPSSVDLYDLSADPYEEKNLASAHPERVAAMQLRINALAMEASKPLFLTDQFKVVLHNMNGEPVLPTDEGYGDPDRH